MIDREFYIFIYYIYIYELENRQINVYKQRKIAWSKGEEQVFVEREEETIYKDTLCVFVQWSTLKRGEEIDRQIDRYIDRRREIEIERGGGGQRWIHPFLI